MKWSHKFALSNYQPFTDFITVDLNCAGSTNRFGDIFTTIFFFNCCIFFLKRGIGYQFIYQISLKIKNEVLFMQQ